MNQFAARRKRLMARHPFCFWCGVEVVEDHGRPPAGNAATIDHVYSRRHPRRLAGLPGRWVLSCFSCNQLRSRIGYENYGLEKIEFDRGQYEQGNT